MKIEQSTSEEEDWSGLISSLNGFAEHAVEIVPLPSIGGQASSSIQLKCVTALTPLDMMSLSGGDHDATGSKVWMGARFFVLTIPRVKSLVAHDKTVLELGSGTGFSGISVMKLCRPSRLVLTDGDDGSVKLCRDNCDLNQLNSIVVCRLDWSDSQLDETFDTIIATDVIYDASLVGPLLSAVERHLSRDGTFLLSHIPRASLPRESKIATAAEMEAHIEAEAQKHSFVLVESIRPTDLSEQSAEPSPELKSLEEAGAALLLFKRVNATSSHTPLKDQTHAAE